MPTTCLYDKRKCVYRGYIQHPKHDNVQPAMCYEPNCRAHYISKANLGIDPEKPKTIWKPR